MAFCLPWEINTRFSLASKAKVAGATDGAGGGCVTGGCVASSVFVDNESTVPGVSCSSNPGVAVGAGTPGESRLTKGPVGVSLMIPAYLPLALIIPRADGILSAGRLNPLSTLVAITSLGNLARR